jgi:serine protease Do
MRLFSVALLGLTAVPCLGSMEALFKERATSIAFIEYYIQREVDRQNGEGIALLVNDEGLMVCLPNVFPEWVPPEWFRDIRLFPADNPVPGGFEATYLGQDWVTSWHYLRINDMEAAADFFSPITQYATAVPKIGESVWGVCLTPGDLDYIPYYREGKLSTIQPLPLDTGFATSEVAVPGGPVFTEKGEFAGWAGRSLPMERDMWIGSEFFRANIRNPDESHMFLLAEPFLAELGERVPENPLAHQRPWIGVTGTQPLDKETARFMGLSDQGAVLVSEVLPGTPAEEAGLEDRDLILAIGGEPLPRLKPDSVLQAYFERRILLSEIGKPLALTVMRKGERLELELKPQRTPTMMRETQREYFEDIGLTLREFIASDAIQRREDHRTREGAIVNFIRPNSPAAAGDLKPGDWLKEIGGEPVTDFARALDLMKELLEDPDQDELVFLIQRSNETSVLRIRKQS